MTEASTETKRGPGRPPGRTPLRDRLRAKNIKRSYAENEDKFHVPGRDKHEGVSVEWKRQSVNGQEDPYYLAAMRQQGWEPMTGEDFPDLVPDGHTGPIVREGMLLMGRPQELTDQALAQERKKAQKQIHDQKVRVGVAQPGELPRVNSDMRGNQLGVQQEYMRQVAVED